MNYRDRIVGTASIEGASVFSGKGLVAFFGINESTDVPMGTHGF